jgi:hypothetical protein
MNSLVMVRENRNSAYSARLAKLYMVHCSPKQDASGRYPRLASPLLRASIATHEMWPTFKAIPLTSNEPRESGVRTNKNPPPTWDAQQTIKIGL